jgi:hypothetical protein
LGTHVDPFSRWRKSDVRERLAFSVIEILGIICSLLGGFPATQCGANGLIGDLVGAKFLNHYRPSGRPVLVALRDHT